MKKALLILSTIGTSITLAVAQISVGGNIIIGYGTNQGQVNGSALLNLLALAQTIVNRLVPFVVGLAVLAFFWFLVEFIWKGRSDPTAKEASLKGIGYSILALFAMVSIWGIIGLIASVTGIGQGGNIPIPSIPTPQ